MEKMKKKTTKYSSIERLNLSDLDRQLINCTSNQRSSSSASISYGQLYDIARSIIAIDFENHHQRSSQQDDNNVDQEQEEFEKTLTKILQLCQTIIDFLLADIRRLEMERNELENGNNLIQENKKLRKLLQLQQKAIVYRRMSFVSTSANTSCSSMMLVPSTEPPPTSNNNLRNGFEENENGDDNSLDNLDQLPSDRTTNSNSNLIRPQKLQCPHCSKMFNDPVAFGKHIQLRHLTSNLDDPSISLSTSTNLTIISKLFQQHCQQQFEQQERLFRSNVESNSNEKVQELQNEISSLRDKLSDTESKLQEEKLARENFENDLKQDFQHQIEQIQKQLVMKMDEIQQLQHRIAIEHKQQIKQENNKSKKTNYKQNSNAQNDEDEPEELEVKSISDSSKQIHSKLDFNDPEITTMKTSKSLDNLKLKEKPTERKTEELKENNVLNLTETIQRHSSLDSMLVHQDQDKEQNQNLKQSLRMELISQLTAKREQKQKELKSVKFNDNHNNHNHNKPTTIQQESNSITKSKHSKKRNSKPQLERSFSIEQEPEQTTTTNDNNTGLNKDQTKTEIYQSVEARIKSYLGNKNSDNFTLKIHTDINDNSGEKNENSANNNLIDETIYNQAMDKIQHDRSLLIQQSRHDYDFVQIENSIRDIIDSKVRNKIKDEQQTEQPRHNDSIDVQESKPEITSTTANVKNLKSNTISSESVKITHLETIASTENNRDSKESQNNSQKSLKSILKDRSKNGSNNSQNKRNITFNNEVIEFEISPLGSENDDDDEDFINDMNVPEPELEIIMNKGDNKQNVLATTSKSAISVDDTHDNDYSSMLMMQRPSNHQILGEKIFLNDNDNGNDLSTSSTTSSTTSSDNELEEQVSRQPTIESTQMQSQTETNQVITIADVHHSIPRSASIPIPAQRKISIQNKPTNTQHSFDSLLGFEEQQLSSESSTPRKSPKRVQELAELIEKKLQSPARSSLVGGNNDNGGSLGGQPLTDRIGNLAHQKLPPLGSLDTRSMMMKMKRNSSSISSSAPMTSSLNTTNSSPMSNHHDHILDAYDLYEF